MSDISEEKLLKRASDASRNFYVLAILTTLLGAILTACAFFTPGMRITLAVSLPLLAISASYYVLAVAARRGDHKGSTVVLTAYFIQLIVSLIGMSYITSGKGLPNLGGILISCLIIVALYQGRQRIVELRNKGLFEKAFNGKKGFKTLSLAGCAIFIVGFIALQTASFATGYFAVKKDNGEIGRAIKLKEIMQDDEPRFANALGENSKNPSQENKKTMYAELENLEKKIEGLAASIPKDETRLAEIMDVYRQAVGKWKTGVALANAESPDMEKSLESFKLGDRLRSQTAQRFNDAYIKK